MNKTSVYLTDVERDRLAWLSAVEGRSQAEILRAAIQAYEPRQGRDRDFVGARSFDGPGDSVADLPEEELLEGFGE